MITYYSPDRHKSQRFSARRQRTSPQITFLRGTTSDLYYGIDKKPVISKLKLISRYNRCGGRSTLTNYQYQDHFDGNATYYFVGNGRISAPETLAKIDIDVQKRLKLGSTQGAIEFAEHLRKRWPDLIYEPSTNGLGLACYAIIGKFNVGAEAVNGSLKHLEQWLKAEAHGFDIEDVEVKGHCPEITYTKHGDILDIKYGQLAKLPRQDVSGTTRLKWDDIRRLPIKKIKLAKQSGGSCVFWDDEEAKGIPEAIESVRTRSYYCYAMRTECGKRGVKVTWQDFAIGFVVLSKARRHRDAEDRLPTKFIELLWQELFNRGVISRAFDRSRFKVIRDTLADCNFTDWTDDSYWFCVNAEGNKVKDGKPMQWCLKEEYTVDYQTPNTHTHIMGEVIPCYEPGKWRPVLVMPPECEVGTADHMLEAIIRPFEEQWHEFALQESG